MAAGTFLVLILALVALASVQPYLTGTTAFGAALAASRPRPPAGAAPSPAPFLRQLGIEQRGSDKSTGISEYRLKANGLTILLAERHSAPVATVMMLYKVGSRNEATGYTGATHFLEHMMFKGSRNFDPRKRRGIDDVLKPIGGINNATTSFDRTSYFEVVPAKYLSLCLQFEADRVRNLLLRDADRKAEMTVVRNELERQENESDALLNNQMFATAYRAHPYHNPIIGWRTDVEGVPTERLRQFYRDFYWADNTTLLVVGDFQTRDALTLIARYFTSLPRSTKPVPTVYTQEPPQEGERRFTICKGADQPKAMLGFHAPRAVDKDSYPLAVIESVLGDETRKSSRLYRALVATGIASSTYSAAYQLRDPGLFLIGATVRAQENMSAVEKAIEKELDKLKREDVPSDELERVKASIIKRTKLDAADPLQLAQQIGEATAVADWRWWAAYAHNISAVTASDIRRASAKYFTDRNRTVGYYLPRLPPPTPQPTSTDESSEDAAAEPQPTAPGFDKPARTLLAPEAAGTGGAVSARVRRARLSNGLTVLILPTPGTGVVAIAGKIRAGDYFAPADKTLLPELVADAITHSSSGLSKEHLAQELDLMGASLEFETTNFWLRFNSAVTSEDTARFLSLLAPVLRQPSFFQSALDECKGIIDSQIKQKMDAPKMLAWNALVHKVYAPGSVYYEKPYRDQLTELATLGRADVIDHHRRYFTPGNVVLCLVGDIDPEFALELIEKNLSGWQAGPVSKITTPRFAMPPRSQKIVINVPDKENVDVLIGHPISISLKHSDYPAEAIANSALGHDPFASRLASVRNRYGLTYDISSYNTDTSYGGAPWVIDFSVSPANCKQALALVHKIVSAFRSQGVSPSELTEEAGRLGGEFLVSLRTPSALAEALSGFEMAGVGASFVDRYAHALKKVTRNQVNQAIRKYLQIDRAITTIAGTIADEPSPGSRTLNGSSAATWPAEPRPH